MNAPDLDDAGDYWVRRVERRPIVKLADRFAAGRYLELRHKKGGDLVDLRL